MYMEYTSTAVVSFSIMLIKFDYLVYNLSCLHCFLELFYSTVILNINVCEHINFLALSTTGNTAVKECLSPEIVCRIHIN